MTVQLFDERAEARADLRRAIAEAREARSLPSLTPFEGVLMRALRVAQDALPADAVERQDVAMALAVYDDGMETLLYRAQVRAAAAAGTDIIALARSLQTAQRGGHVAIGGAA